MKRFRVSTAMILGLAGAACAADVSAEDIIVTKTAPAATAKAPSQPATCTSTWNHKSVLQPILRDGHFAASSG